MRASLYLLFAVALACVAPAAAADAAPAPVVLNTPVCRWSNDTGSCDMGPGAQRRLAWCPEAHAHAAAQLAPARRPPPCGRLLRPFRPPSQLPGYLVGQYGAAAADNFTQVLFRGYAAELLCNQEATSEACGASAAGCSWNGAEVGGRSSAGVLHGSLSGARHPPSTLHGERARPHPQGTRCASNDLSPPQKTNPAHTEPCMHGKLGGPERAHGPLPAVPRLPGCCESAVLVAWQRRDRLHTC
jgi:hypothetical protein